MKVSPLILCTLAIAGFTAFALVTLAPETDAGPTSGTSGATTAENAVVGAINTASASVRESDDTGWAAPIYKDSMLDIVANARELAVIGARATQKEEANAALDTAARLVDIALRRVDGESGDDPQAHLNDWTVESKLTAQLHGVLLQARSEILRIKRD